MSSVPTIKDSYQHTITHSNRYFCNAWVHIALYQFPKTFLLVFIGSPDSQRPFQLLWLGITIWQLSLLSQCKRLSGTITQTIEDSLETSIIGWNCCLGCFWAAVPQLNWYMVQLYICL